MYTLHPRYLQYGRYWQRQKLRELRLRPGILSVEHYGPSTPNWVDYFPDVPGTIPEKMVFAELRRRQISFFFASFWGDSPFSEGKKERFRPDFILPEYRIVLEVFGAYWHSRSGSAKRDARRALQYEAAGYKHYILWDWEIYTNVKAAVDTVPDLVAPLIQTGRVFVSDRPFDPVASIRAQRRAKPKVIRVRSAKGELDPLIRSSRVARLRMPSRVRRDPYEAFGGYDEDTLREVRAHGLKWKRYVEQLGEYFRKYPRLKGRYKEQYWYYLRWRGWWTRWQRYAGVSE